MIHSATVIRLYGLKIKPTLGALIGSGPTKKTPAVGFSSLKTMRTINVAKLTPELRTGAAAGV
jgi:hypothetical protein